MTRNSKPNPEPTIGAGNGMESWTELAGRVAEMSTPHLPFYMLVTLSTTIAAYGLLANSTAVVIGAMLVAPLMGPIFGIGFGLATGDTDLLGRSVSAELRGIALAIGLAYLIGRISPVAGFGPEILARTQPTVYDIVVALASGLAGAFALADRRVGVALPGVAIATAIVPPLATAGLCLAAGRYNLAAGAFLLFAANLIAIEIAAVGWFTIIGVRRGHLHEHFTLRGFMRHFGVSLVLLLAISIFMTRTLLTGIATERRRDRIHRVLADEVRITQGARLSELVIESGGRDSLRVFAVLLTPQEFRAEQVRQLETQLQLQLDEPVQLIVRSIISRDASSRGLVYVEDEEVERRDAAARQTAFLTLASQVLTAQFAIIPGVELEEIRRERSDTANIITAVVRTPVALSPPQVDSLDRMLDFALNTPVHLIVRSVLTRDANATRYLYESDSILVTDDTVSGDPSTTATSRSGSTPGRRGG